MTTPKAIIIAALVGVLVKKDGAHYHMRRKKGSC